MIKAATFPSSVAILFLLIASGNEIKAQRLELSPFLGYETGSTIYTSLGYLYIGDGVDWGAVLDYNLGRNSFIEISYSHMTTNLNVDEGYNETYLCDLGVNYYSIGILREFKPDSKIKPFGLFSTGWVNYHPKTDDISGENKMHFSVAGGIKVRVSEKIGVRLQARLLLPILYAGNYFSTGSGGTSMNVSATSVAFQGDFTGAIVFSIR